MAWSKKSVLARLASLDLHALDNLRNGEIQVRNQEKRVVGSFSTWQAVGRAITRRGDYVPALGTEERF